MYHRAPSASSNVSNSRGRSGTASGTPHLAVKPGLESPLNPREGVARAVALYDFKAVEVSDVRSFLCPHEGFVNFFALSL
jgi:hypothetical protein